MKLNEFLSATRTSRNAQCPQRALPAALFLAAALSGLATMHRAEAQSPLPPPDGGPTNPPPSGSSSSGHWELFQWEYDGGITTIQPNSPTTTRAWVPPFGVAQSPSITPEGGPGSISASGKLRPILRWVRRTVPQANYTGPGYPPNVPDPNDNPPNKIYLLFLGRGEGYAASSLQPAQRVLSKEHLSLSFFGSPPEKGKDVGDSTHAITEAAKSTLVQVQGRMRTDAQGNELLDCEWVNIESSASVDGNRYNNGGGSGAEMGYVYLSTSAGYVFDERQLKITRAGAPTPKTEIDGSLDKAHDEWIDADGNGHGHSRWSYTRFYQYAGPYDNPQYTTELEPVSQVFTATPTGTSWSPYSQLQGTWYPSDSRDQVPPSASSAGHSHPQNMPDGGATLDTAPKIPGIHGRDPGWYDQPGAASGKQEITYVLKDTAKGTQSSAQYSLTLHNEWENGRPGSLPNRVYNTEYPVKVNSGVVWYHDDQSHKFSGKVTHTWKVSGNAKIKLHDLFHIFPEAEAGVGGEYGGSKEFAVESTISQTTAPYKHRYFYVNIHEEQKHYLVDQFGVNGFLGAEDVWVPYQRAQGYEAGFSHEYDDTDFDTRDHHGPNDLVDQNGNYTELETPSR